MNSLEILDKKAQLKDKAFSMIDTCKAEIRNFTDTELEEYNNIKKEITELNEELRNINAALSPSVNINNNLNNKLTMEKNFSLIKAIRSVSNNKALDNVTAAVVEAGAEEMRKAGEKVGFFRPITVGPFPEQKMAEISKKVKKVVIKVLVAD